MRKILAGFRPIRVVSCLLVFAATFFAQLTQLNVQEYSKCLFKDACSIDMIEQHMLAVNLYSTGRYPIAGFLQEEPYYKLCNGVVEEDVNRTQLYLDFFRELGPVPLLTRPPLYPAVIAFTYKVFGYNLAYPIYLNAAFVALAAVVLFCMGLGFSKKYGFLLGISMVAIFMASNKYLPQYLFPDALHSLLVISFVSLFIKGLQSYYKAGMFFSLSLLSKGFLLPGLVIIPAAMLLGKGRNRIKGAVFFTAGAITLLVPWMIYVNILNNNTAAERESWRERMLASHPITKVADYEELASNEQSHAEAYKSWITHFYDFYMQKPSFVVLTTQFIPKAFLRYHNEYCIDGQVHPEHFLFKGSFYNQLDTNLTAIQMLIRFYGANPNLIFKIAYAKLQSAYVNQTITLVPFATILSLVVNLFLAGSGRAVRWAYVAVFLICCILALVLSGGLNMALLLFFVLANVAFFLLPLNIQRTDLFIFQVCVAIMNLNTVIFHGSPLYISVLEPIACYIVVTHIYRLYPYVSSKLSLNLPAL